MGIASALRPVRRGRDFGYLTGNRARASLAGLFWNLANVFASVVLTSAVFLVTSRILQPTEFGAVAMAVAIISITGTLVPMAFGDALVQRENLEERHTDSVFWLTAGIALVGAGVLAISAPLFADWTGVPQLTWILPILAIRLVFDAGLTVPAALITRRMEFRYIAIRTTLANGVGAALCLWMVTHGYALLALVLAQVVTSVTAFAITIYAAGWRPGFRVSRSALTDLRRFGLYAMGGRILNEARLDQLVLGLVLGPASLGLYFFARRLQQMLRDMTAGIFAPVTNVLLASLRSDEARRREFYLAACFASAAFAFPVFAGLIAVAPAAIPLIFGTQWTGAVFATQCFAVVGLLAGLGVMQAGLIRYLGAPGWWFWYQGAMQLSTLPLILLLAPYGLDAIMAAVVVRTLILWPLSVAKAQRMLGIGLAPYLKTLAAPALSAAAMAGLVAALPWLLAEMREALQLVCQVGAGALIYALSMALLARGDARRLLALWRAEKAVAA